MRVGFFAGTILPDFFYGGGAVFQGAIIEALRRVQCGHDFYVYYRCLKSIFPKLDGRVHFVNVLEEVNAQADQHPLNTLVLRDKIELLYFITIDFEVIGVPFVYTVWDLEHRHSPFFPELSVTGWDFTRREQLFSSVIPRAYCTVIGNETGKRQVCNYYQVDSERVRVLPLPVADYIRETPPDDGILAQLGLEPQKYLFYPAQFWPHKNHVRLVKAMAALREQGLKLVLSGRDFGNQKYVRQKVAEYGLQDCVLFPGFVENAGMVALYRNAYAMTFASFCGPDNLPPIEAMALGCPVICSDFTGARDQLGENALYFDPRDESGVIAGVNALRDPALRQRLVSGGLELAQSRTAANYVKQMLTIVDDFIPYRECWSSQEVYIHP